MHFRALFVREVGTTPKSFVRIRRFQSALAGMRRRGRFDWCALAAAAGYSDQAHLIRDFKAFTGLTPAAYAALYAPRQAREESTSDFFSTAAGRTAIVAP